MKFKAAAAFLPLLSPTHVSLRHDNAAFIGDSFSSSLSTPSFHAQRIKPLFMDKDDIPEDIASMRIGALKQELQSLGISTKAMLEKKELVEALVKARAEGLQPVSSPDSSSSSSNESSSSSTSAEGSSRADKIAKEMEKLKSAKVGELKAELQSMGISTRSFFEKSEFIRALAEARVDGIKADSAGSEQEDEPYDPSFRDVQVQKMNKGSARGGGRTIDVQLG